MSIASRGVVVVVAAGLFATVAACGYSEEELQMATRGERRIAADLDAERAAHARTKYEVTTLRAQVDALMRIVADSKSAGGGPAADKTPEKPAPPYGEPKASDGESCSSDVDCEGTMTCQGGECAD